MIGLIGTSITIILPMVTPAATNMDTYWVYISGKVKFEEIRKAKNAEMILYSGDQVLDKSKITKNGEYSLKYAVKTENNFQLKAIQYNKMDTVLLKDVTHFESQFVEWNFNL